MSVCVQVCVCERVRISNNATEFGASKAKSYASYRVPLKLLGLYLFSLLALLVVLVVVLVVALLVVVGVAVVIGVDTYQCWQLFSQ